MTDPNTYDEVPYPDLAFPQTHPNRTAAMASLFGLSPPDPRRARVLELGCAAGANLLPMGIEMPQAEFLGLDLSAGQIEAGEAIRREAEIANVVLRQADILDRGALEGRFDYIIAHGLYSWVPPAVAERVLEICSEHLAPNGIAYVSYNVYPGWHFRGVLRGMMMYHAAGFADPKLRIRQGKALVDFLAARSPQGFFADTLKAGADLMRDSDDNYLYHEYLETENHPAYFHEFAARAHARGLAYLGGTQLPGVVTKTLPADTVQALQRAAGGDALRMEQYTDFLTNRTFRESLLVHRGQSFQRTPDWKPLRHLWITHWLTPGDPAFDPASGNAATFESRSGVRIALKDPFAKTVLALLLAQYGQPMPFADLLRTVREHLRSSRAAELDEAELGRFILELLGHGVAEITAAPWPAVAQPGERPLIGRLARNQARAGQTIVTLRHQRLDNPSRDHRGLIELFDGHHSIEQALDAMFGRIDMARLPESARALAGDPQRLRAAFDVSMRAVVDDLRRAGLFLS